MADADRTLKILLQIQSDIADLTKVTGGVKNLRGELSETAKAGFSLTDAFKFAGADRALNAVLQVVKEIPAKLYEGVHAGVEFNAELQQMQIGIAAVLQLTQPGRFANFEAAKVQAADYIDTIKQKANELGIEYRDMFESVTHTQAQLASAGVTDINKAIELTAILNRAMQSVGVSATQAGRDIGDILQGQAARTLGGARVASALGMSKEDFDEWIKGLIQTGTLYDGLTKKMAPLATAARAASTTFTADMNRMKNAVIDLQSEAARPLMQPLQDALEHITTVLRTTDAQAWARTLGQSFVELTAGIIEGTRALKAFIDQHRLLIGVASLGGSELLRLTAGGLGSAQQAAAEQIHIEQLQKQTEEIEKQIRASHDEQTVRASMQSLNGAISSVQKEITLEKLKGQAADAGVLSQLFNVLSTLQAISGKFFEIQGIAEGTATAVKHITPELQKFLDATALFHAQTYGDEAEVYRAKWTATYNALAEESKKVGAQLSENELNQLTYERLRGPERQREINQLERTNTLSKDITEYTRQTSTLLEQIRGGQNLIAQNPFMSVDQKNSALLQLLPQEMAALNQQINAGKTLIANSALDPSQYEQVRQKIIQDTFALEALKLKLASLSFGGQLRTELTSWVNQFGTGAHQLAGIITGTLNTAIGATSNALTALIFKTGNWRQAFAQAAQSIVQNIIQIALQFVVSRLLMSALNKVAGTADSSAASAQASGAAAAWAPAATSASIATYGTAAGVGTAAYLAALAAGVAGATAFAGAGGGIGGYERGGFTFGSEGRAAGIVHGQEFVFSAPAVRAIGVERLDALHRSAGGKGYQDGGLVSPDGGDVHVFVFHDLKQALQAHQDSPAQRKHFRRSLHANRV